MMPIIHKKVVSRASGRDGWTLRCSCGRVWHGWRWLCEEQFNEHIPDETIEERVEAQRAPLWWDDASYIRYQSMP